MEDRPTARPEGGPPGEPWPPPRTAQRLEVVPRSMVAPIAEYALVIDSSEVGEFEWMSGFYPELHLEVGVHSGFVAVKRLRPFVLAGRLETRDLGFAEILHVGSAGEGLVEVDGIQFVRRTSPNGTLEVRDEGGAVVLTSPGSSSRRILAYDRASSNLDVPGLLELTLVQAFCAIHTRRRMLQSMLSAWVRPPRMGTPLASLPEVRACIEPALGPGGGGNRQGPG